MNNGWLRVSRQFSPRFVLFLAVVFLLPGASRADFLTVGCPGGPPGQFPSITAALNALPVNSPSEPHTIQVTGNCLENVFIANRQRIAIWAPQGQTATLTAANPAGIVVGVFASRSIDLRRLIIQGGTTGVLVTESQVFMQDETIQGNTNEGLHAQINSILDLQSSTIQNNGGDGLLVDANSSATIGVAPQQTVRISNNGGNGVDIDGSYFQVNFGNLKVENNAGDALDMAGGRLLLFGAGGAGGENLFQNNAGGLNFLNDASVQFFGQTTIRNNGQVGIQVLGSSVAFNGGVLPDGTFNATVIEGHSVLGVNIVRLGEVSFGGPHKIRNNSAPGADPEYRSGARVMRSSLTLQNGAEITENSGPGILSDFNSSIGMGPNANISNNTEEGLRVTHQTVTRVFGPVTFQGNGTASISCDGTSLVYGDLAGINDLACDNVEFTSPVALRPNASSASPRRLLPH